MTKKQLKFKIYQHECVDCGWKIWRDFVIEDPICSKCESTNTKVTEDELIREIVVNDTYTPEEYENAKRIAQEIVDGKPLEEIEGLGLGTDLTEDALRISAERCLASGAGVGLSSSCFSVLQWFDISVGIAKTPELKNHYY
jgi:hypothetical protein